MTNNPIIIVEDDYDDCMLLTSALKQAGMQNEYKYFDTPIPALQYLRSTNEFPSIIISDINMPVMNGIMFKKEIEEDSYLKEKKIPFVFLSTLIAEMDESLRQSVAGSFRKPSNLNAYPTIAKNILEIRNRLNSRA